MLSCLSAEEKKQYIISVVASALINKANVDLPQAKQMIGDSLLQRMLDDGHVDYVLGTDEDYWADQILANKEGLKDAD